MAYATYTTRAIVCGSKDSHTSDRSYLLFTEEAGMLWAAARSVRMEKSKQRFALVDFSIIRVSLVKGRTGWRVGSVEALANPFLSARSLRDRALITNLIRLLRRYVHGEEPVRPVFNDLTAVYGEAHSLDQADLVPLQLIFTLRLLHTLGYVESEKTLLVMLKAKNCLEALTYYEPALKREIEKVIANAEQVSHL